MAEDPKRPRRAQTQTERDLEGLARIRAERARQQQQQQAAPEPFDDVDTGMTERINSDPDLALLFAKNERLKSALVQQRQESANLVLEVAGERPPAERFEKVEKRLRFAYWILSAILIPVIMSLVIAAKYVYTRGGRDVKIDIEHKQMVDDIAELKRQNIEQGQQLAEALELARRNGVRIDDLLRRATPTGSPARSPRAPARVEAVSPQPSPP